MSTHADAPYKQRQAQLRGEALRARRGQHKRIGTIVSDSKTISLMARMIRDSERK